MKQPLAKELIAMACQPDCPVGRAAQVIEGKWTTLVVRELLAGPRRFGQLLTALDGISPKVLTERLRLLEGRGLVHKEIYPVVPPHTEYSLTDKGMGLLVVIKAMAEFGATL
ncbi:MAG: helix-turn-helix transcriptional regulator [Magnetospirillum sp.]|nr:helix-turn-helix transcriptional regulator [Magnetospirillum sp.]